MNWFIRADERSGGARYRVMQVDADGGELCELGMMRDPLTQTARLILGDAHPEDVLALVGPDMKVRISGKVGRLAQAMVQDDNKGLRFRKWHPIKIRDAAE